MGGNKKTKKNTVRKVVNGSKRDRVNYTKQYRDNKNNKLAAGASKMKTIVLIGFREDVNVLQVKQELMRTCGSEEIAVAFKPQTVTHQGCVLTFIDAPREMIGAMDCAKVADIVLACMPDEATIDQSAFDDKGYDILSTLKLQGLPTVFGVCEKQHKMVERYFHSELSKEDKLFNSKTSLLRQIACCNPKVLNWRKDRGYLVVDRAEHDGKQLAVCGYVRGDGFNCKHLVHITGHGDFQLDKIVLMENSLTIDAAEMHQDRENLDPLQAYDPLSQEQTWPTEEELNTAKKVRVRMPKVAGMTDYEVGWLGEQMDADMDNDGSQDEAEGVDSDFGNLELPEEFPEKSKKPDFTFEERTQEDLEFPDEVDTPMDIPARIRFQKYRGLQNFRAATWDAYEELPVEYSRIYEFDQFQAATKEFKQDFKDTCEIVGGMGTTGRYVCLYITCAQPKHPANVPMIVSSLLPNERKVTVMHANLQRCGEEQKAIKSKDEVEMHCGFRRIIAAPIYSEVPKKHITDNKRRMMRYFHGNTAAVASFYAPTMYSPCPALLFHNGTLQAWGSLDTSDTLRCIIKRIVLAGYPFRVHKTKAVVRHMFWNPLDIKYFKPLELSTKHGLRGHITESLGTHGYMKCKFNDRIKHDDTICINLYKRVFPRWCSKAWGRADQKPEDE